jgi:ABC-type cobalamin/Fe3+-siderophores transport system ATPase subunit
MSEKPSIQAIHQKRRAQSFVGRDLEIESFRRNLELPYEDRKYVWNVYGQGGIGKTTLLKRYLTIASEHGAVTTLTDESQSDILDVMSTASEQLTNQSISLQPFAKRYRVFRQLREQVESDPSLPSGPYVST